MTTSNTTKLSPAPAQSVRKVTVAGSIGMFVEFYDNGVFGFLAGIIALNFFPPGAESVGLLFSFGIFAVTFVFRPVGGVLLGMMADRVGRRPVMVLALTLMTGATTVIGLLPGYASWGIASVVVLLLMRVIQGISAGGEVSTAMSFVGEYAPAKRRALMMSWPQMGTTVALLTGTGMAYFLTSTLAPADMESWGWRIPFLVAAPLGIIGFYIRRKLEDTPAFVELKRRGKVSRNPLRESFSRGNRGKLALAFAIPMLNSSGFYVLFVYMPTYLSTQAGFSRPNSLMVGATVIICSTVAIPFAAHLSDRKGRRPVMLGSCIAIAALAYPCYLLLGTGDMTLALLAGVLLGLAFAGTAGVIHPALLEMFPTHVRNTAYSLGYNLTTAIFGGAAPLILTALIGQTSNILMPAFFVILTALGSGVAVLVHKETAHRSLTDDV
jgi:MHS family proline/betaine transporter-like MFS transporter